ncbi:MAG: hypothetical protein SV186_00565 [Candidatus Nanohaloarchaea archaeon]|nr:hypothetical protein [Candidatus Nanohaloarchaea archaeon]
MTLQYDDTFGTYAEALQTEEGVEALTDFVSDGDVPDDADDYLDTFNELGFIDRDAGETRDLGEYVVDMVDQYDDTEQVATLFDTVQDELGVDVFNRVVDGEVVSMRDVASDNDASPSEVRDRYDALEDAGFAEERPQGRRKKYKLTDDEGEQALDDLEEFADQVDRYGADDALDRIANRVGTVTEEQKDVTDNRVLDDYQ